MSEKSKAKLNDFKVERRWSYPFWCMQKCENKIRKEKREEKRQENPRNPRLFAQFPLSRAFGECFSLSFDMLQLSNMIINKITYEQQCVDDDGKSLATPLQDCIINYMWHRFKSHTKIAARHREGYSGEKSHREQQHSRAIEWEKKDNEKNVHNCGIILCKPRKSLLSIFLLKKKKSTARSSSNKGWECREFVVVIAAAAVVGCIYHGSRKHMAIGEIQTTDFCDSLDDASTQKGWCSRQHLFCGVIWWEIWNFDWMTMLLHHSSWNAVLKLVCSTPCRLDCFTWSWDTTSRDAARARERGKVSRAQNYFSSLWKVFISSPLLLAWASDSTFCFSAKLERKKIVVDV